MAEQSIATLEQRYGAETLLRFHQLVNESLAGVSSAVDAFEKGRGVITELFGDVEVESGEGMDLAKLLGALLDHAHDMIRWDSSDYQGGAP